MSEQGVFRQLTQIRKIATDHAHQPVTWVNPNYFVAYKIMGQVQPGLI
jgi:hypothetical protein